MPKTPSNLIKFVSLDQQPNVANLFLRAIEQQDRATPSPNPREHMTEDSRHE